ncbi:rab9 effector protein with kelch motifs [Anaeramoeba flamelloides]|uniref:Rab9 effector protein with kelch motifs n=1 Tax=Anaeramoeba flamelloides TaxID=1746091 RepID=A0AAV7Z4T7_9EUKA|nr:rab9 effector protein with kelch motifs [Anaeramoeba flamelloides]
MSKLVRWEELKVTGEIPEKTSKASVVMISETEFVLLFGFSSQTTDKIYHFSLNTNTWTIVNSPSKEYPASRYGASADLYKGDVYVFGGISGQIYYKEFWKLSQNTWEWQKLDCENGPSGRQSHRTVIIGSQLFLYGGRLRNGQSDELWVYDLNGELGWNKITLGGQKPPQLSSQLMFKSGSNLVIYGGVSISTYTNEMYMISLKDFNSIKIKQTSTSERPSNRASSAGIIWNNYLILFGGRNQRSEYFNDFHLFNLDTNSWSPAKTMFPPQSAMISKRACHNCIKCKDGMLVIGGEFLDGDVWLLRILDDLKTDLYDLLLSQKFTNNREEIENESEEDYSDEDESDEY